MEKDSKEQLTTTQINALKPVFIFVCLLILLFAWLIYYTYTRESGWYVVWMLVYFYLCNVATNLRAVIKWPFHGSPK